MALHYTLRVMQKPHRIASKAHLDRAITALLAADARLHPVARRAGALGFRRRRDEGFEALASIIVSQQLSVAAADTIFRRLKVVVTPFSAETILAAPAETLRSCGLSGPKQRHLKSVANAILSGALDLSALRILHDDEARAQLMAIKGVGRWTADIYLMSSLGRADIWPANDVGLQAATARALNLRKRPNEKQMEKLSQVWRPWRTVAARLFWIHEDGLRREKKLAEEAAKAQRAARSQKARQ
jgi:DNA-3-methyladenine glycosylase II